MSPKFTTQDTPEISPGIRRLLPEQGSFELQNDGPGKVHDWHRHSLDEELFVISGEVLLFWSERGEYHERKCSQGTWITLPAGTVHGSVASSDGAIYMIRPQDGRTAETTFLPPESRPHPTPALT
jgi:quercetin dioxygenase-like cupin family protein